MSIGTPLSRSRQRRRHVFPLLLVLGTWSLQSTVARAAPGELDPSFGSGRGYVVTRFTRGYYARLGSAYSTSDGRVVAIGGEGLSHFRFGFALARYRVDGSLDESFGSGGRTTLYPPRDLDNWTRAPSGGPGPNGSTLVAGLLMPAYVSVSADRFVASVVAARVDQAGALDRSYGSDGFATVPIALEVPHGVWVWTAHVELLGVSVSSDGALTAVVWWRPGPSCPYGLWPCPSYLAAARFTPDGTPDGRFGTKGIVVVPTPETAGYTDMASTPDGGIVIVGGTGLDIVVRRLSPDGRPNLSFGMLGTAIIDGGGVERGDQVAVDADGRLYVGGFRVIRPLDGTPPSGSSVIVPLDEKGQMQRSFGDDGWASIPRYGSPEALITTSDGIFAAWHSGVARLTPDGAVVWALEGFPLDPSLAASIDVGAGTVSVGSTTSKECDTSCFVVYRILF